MVAARGRGRPPFQPTRAQRDNVELMVAIGKSHETIARLLGIDDETLRKHFPVELEHGKERKQQEVMNLLMKSAKKGNVSAQKHLQAVLGAAAIARPVTETRAEAAPVLPKAPKLGKKEEAKVAAANPDASTPMGDLISRRMAPPSTRPH